MKYPGLMKKQVKDLFDFKVRKFHLNNSDEVEAQINADLQGLLASVAAYKKHKNLMPALPNSVANVGIEVEVENINRNFHHNGWIQTKDGSLRNGGLEYVSLVYRPEIVNQQIAFLFAGLSTMRPLPEFSWRTSIHIHLCVRDRTLEELLKLFLLYLTFERTLFLYADQEREHSVFCVPVTKSSLTEDLAGFFSQEHGINHLLDMWHKYSALNITRLNDYGTFEFRHLSGTWDVKKISVWIGSLLSLYNSAIDMPLDKIVDEIKTLNTTSRYMAFKDDTFGKFSKYLEVPNLELISEGVSFCKECLSGINKHQIKEDSSMMKYIRREKERKKSEGSPFKVNYDLGDALQQKLAPGKLFINAVGALEREPPINIPNQWFIQNAQQAQGNFDLGVVGGNIRKPIKFFRDADGNVHAVPIKQRPVEPRGLGGELREFNPIIQDDLEEVVEEPQEAREAEWEDDGVREGPEVPF